MMPKIPPVSHTVLMRLKQHLHSEKKLPSREYRCGTGQIPSEGQVREGKLCVPRFVRVLGFLQQQGLHPLFLGVEVFSLQESSQAYFTGSFPYRDPLNIIKRGKQDNSLYATWIASKLTSGPSALFTSFSFLGVGLIVPSAFKYIQHLSQSQLTDNRQP